MRRPKRHQSKLQQRVSELNGDLRTCRAMCSEAMREGLSYKKKMDKLEYELQRVQERTETCKKIIERACTIDFNRNSVGQYAIEVTFNGDFMGGINRYGAAQEYVARDVANMIEQQIRSSKFIETAKMNERRQYMANVRRAYQGGEWINGE